ncbi:MAG: 8-amino-7-oxononanoate synthase [Nitrospirae bacterium RBG_13_39_12]|nr:MAG: 8-amino-7-oxononanoate synthase [Nitrospirae bacterium RBG_13_39_12]
MFFEKLEILKKKRLLRNIRNRESPQGPKIRFGGREYINFSSNDYLGLANNPLIINKIKKSIDDYGYGSASSRLLSGGSILHKELEDRLTKFKGAESALVFNSGYSANIGIIPAISDENSVIFSDELNHASIIDGCRLSKGKTIIYRHKDIPHLEDLVKKEDANSKIIITDTVFSMDGDIAPLNDIYNICKKYRTLLYIDDAHGTGVLGNGRGALSHFNIKPEPWIIQMGTFSKALGSYGAFAAGSRDVIEWVQNTSRSFMFSTALPSCIIAASIAALELIEENPELIKRLWTNRNKVAEYIQRIKFNSMQSETPIISLRTGTVENTLRISGYLLEKGIFAPAIRPPAVKDSRIRISVTATHTDDDIERLIETLKEV